jgi:hypothetical protein
VKSELKLVQRSASSSYVAWRHLLLVFGYGPPDRQDVLEYGVLIEDTVRRTGGRGGVVTVIAPGSTPQPEARHDLIRVFAKAASKLSAAAFVVQAQGFVAAAQRGVLSGMVLAMGYRARVNVTPSAESAVAWLTQKLAYEDDPREFASDLALAIEIVCEQETAWRTSRAGVWT